MSQLRLPQYRLVMVQPKTPGNVGSAARVAANFGCDDWVIADPKCAWDTWEAQMYAMGDARRALDSARSTPTLKEAVKDCQITIGFSRRLGKSRKATIELGEIAALGRETGAKIALIFGSEETGLSSDDLKSCSRLCSLPTTDAMRSMNLSHSIAAVLSRIYDDETQARAPLKPSTLKGVKARAAAPNSRKVASPARIAEFDGMIRHWGEFLSDIGMNTAGNPDRMAESLRKLFARADILPREVRMMHGFLSKAQVALGLRSRGKRLPKA